MMNVAMEIEEPILDYSHHNGEGFRLLLPALARFMGKNREEEAYAATHGLPWSESPWCAEERRHANTFARMIERLTKTSPGRENPNRPMVASADEDDAVRLMVSREAAEWNSSSTYVVMAAHATGDLHTLIRNIARDEIKHLSILSAAALYLFGPAPWRRFATLVRKGLDEYRGQKSRRSRGELLGTNPITSLEVIACHLLTEYYVRRWLKSIPLFTLAFVFETPTGAPDEKRAGLTRWPPAPRRIALEEQDFAKTNTDAIHETIATKLDHFSGAETPGCREEKKVRRKVRTLGTILSRACLHRLRDYQIRNNRHVLARPGYHTADEDQADQGPISPPS